jgi:iron complex transport system ATP-binding protein
MIARALAQQCPILLLDEPTAHLDLRHQALLAELMRQLAKAGLAVLVAVHDLNLAVRLADRLALLRAGRLEGLGPPVPLLSLERLRAVFDADFHIGQAADGLPFYLPLGAAPGPGGGPAAGSGPGAG